MAAKTATGRLKKTAKRAKKTVRRGSKKAKRRVSKAKKAVKRGAATAKKTASRAKKAVRRAKKKAKKTARRAKKAVKRAAKKAKRKARKVRLLEASAEREGVRRAITRVNGVFVDAMNRGDIAAAVRVYTVDAKVLPPGAPMVRGREAIQEFWQGAVSQLGVTGVTLESVEVEIQRRTAQEIGRFTISSAAGVIDEGKYVVLWKREAGDRWKWHVDIWNSSRG